MVCDRDANASAQQPLPAFLPPSLEKGVNAMKTLVVGGTRFVGAHVVKQLFVGGHDVTVFHRGQSRHPDLPDVRHICDPLANYPIKAFPPEIAERSWDLVVHMVLMGEPDARAAVAAFTGKIGRIVMISSGDVYRAYGRLTGAEPGPPDHVPLDETAPLRESRYPYRGQEHQLGAFARDYEKILAERILIDAEDLRWTILRLPKVYGPEDNADLGTIYGFAAAPDWRWTHGHVRNVAGAIVHAATHPLAVRRVFNVGEAETPTMAERLSSLPQSQHAPPTLPQFDFEQDLVLDTTQLRSTLGFADLVDETAAKRTLVQMSAE